MAEQLSPKRILVLGATSGIAEATMRHLVTPGSQFCLVGRNEAKLAAVASDLRTRGAAEAFTYALDLDRTDQHIPMLEGAVKQLGALDLAFIAHGVLGDQLAAQASYEEAAKVFHTNFLSSVSLITWLANYFEQQHRGTLAVISSVAGERGRKSLYVYGSSKAALTAFLSGVRNRIDRSGAHVLTIKPGVIATKMTAGLKPGPLTATADAAGKGIAAAIRSRKDVAYVPGYWAAIMFVIRAIPESIFKRTDIG
jgi:decaprenylphospho-beta-D-erythro-pentofuranosid-2-ulose 2-reductase